MEERIRVRIGTVLNDNGVDILSEDGGSLLHDLCRVIEQELDRAREKGRKEVLENELFIGDYDVLKKGLRIRTVDRENFLAQIYKTCKDEDELLLMTKQLNR